MSLQSSAQIGEEPLPEGGVGFRRSRCGRTAQGGHVKGADLIGEQAWRAVGPAISSQALNMFIEYPVQRQRLDMGVLSALGS